MTIQFLTSWNGYEFGQVRTLGGAEAGLIAAGIARAWSPGIDPTSDRAAVLRYDLSGALVGLVAHDVAGAEVVVPITTSGALPTPPAAGKVLTSTGNVAGGYTWSDPTGGSSNGDSLPVTHSDAVPMDTAGFGKVANALVDVTNARTITIGGAPIPRAAYEVTFRGDGNNSHAVTFSSDFLRSSQGASVVSTASQRLSRVLFEYDADIAKVVYIIQDLSGTSAGATAVTMTGPNAGTVSQQSTNFTLGADGTITGSIIVTPNDNGGGGAFTPANRTLTSTSPTATFTYTPATTGVKTVSVTNSGGLTNPSDIVYVSNPAFATAIVVNSAPGAGTTGIASSPFVFAANGAVVGTVIVTPSSAGGTFSPTSVSLTTGSPTGSATFTPSSVGTKTIAIANDGGLTNPASLSYVSGSAASVYLEDDLLSGVVNNASVNGRTPSLSNANGHNWLAYGGWIGQYGGTTMNTPSGDGPQMQMGQSSYRVDVTAQITAGHFFSVGFKDDITQPLHSNYQYDYLQYDVDTGKLEYWTAGPGGWTLITDIANLHATGTPGDSGGLHKYSWSLNDATHQVQFYIDDVAYGTPATVRTNSRNDFRMLSNGCFVSHIKVGTATN